jgi:hypothetical protein
VRYVSLGFLGEGPSDWDVQRIVVQRSIDRLFVTDHVDSPFEFDIFYAGKSSTEELRAVIGRNDFDVVVAHRDGASSPIAVRSAIMECGPVVPLVPRREMEAWLLADCPAICESVGRSSGCPLNTSECGRRAENFPDPKMTLRQMVTRCRPSKSLHWQELLPILATTLRIETLERFEWYRTFVADLRNRLTTLGWPYR